MPRHQAAFVALAVLNFLAIGVGFGFSAYLTSLSAGAEASSRAWAGRVSEITQIASVAERTSVAVNEVLSSSDANGARERKQSAMAEFEMRLASFASSLNAGADVDERVGVADALVSARGAMTRVNAHAEATFRAIEMGDRRSAVSHLAAVNAAHGELNRRLFEAVNEAQTIQARHLGRQEDIINDTQMLLFGSGGLLLFLVLVVSFRGAGLARSLQLNAIALAEARIVSDEANQRKSEFLANMSHELRTPLNAIIGYSEMMREGAEESERLEDIKDLDRVIGAAKRQLHLINEILDLSKIEAGRTEANMDVVDVASLVREATESVLPQCEANGNILTVELAPDLGPIHTDGLKLSQCVVNLLSNAVKFTQQGKVTMRVWQQDARIIFEVEDTGVGIPSEKIAGLFQPFVQADASVTRTFGGTGLGLAITRRFAQLLGGDVMVSSIAGRGSTFRLEVAAILGRVTHDDLAAVSAPEQSAFVADQESPLVVIIEDDPLAQDIVTRVLTPVGFRVRGATSARAGLDLIRDLRPSLIILDIELPDLSGWKVLELCRADAICASIPILVLSVDDDRARAIALGACDHKAKPIDRGALAASALRYARSPAGDRPTANLRIDAARSATG